MLLAAHGDMRVIRFGVPMALPLELEQVVERLTAAGRRRRTRFALDRVAGREQRARVGRILRTHSSTNDLPALECRARIERLALNTGVKINTALATLAEQRHVG